MAFKIVTSQCSACGACEFECPNAAISIKNDAYKIDAAKCTECDGDEPKCVSVCPVPNTCVRV